MIVTILTTTHCKYIILLNNIIVQYIILKILNSKYESIVVDTNKYISD